ncbi:condensation domain-containing protein [Microbacterium sp. LRZ72]|uniref:condensation domain-containing protein n=1 Tax=Microbacterium sp. LRZ72 TaxID=2942481 RepID=UPI0029BFA6DA|nr:condensation domain-containing protein [Microbacterium sp. LRZ72]MDX2376403.1 condensation domain-containing protein [Microbacterium sp. LRZ72]
MRLTNVAQMSLPPGRLWSYSPRPSGQVGRALPLSFDQRRHVGEGDRPGSWMAIAFHPPGDVSPPVLARAWAQMIARHGTLRTAFSRTLGGVLALHEIELGEGQWVEHPVPDGASTRDALRAVLDRLCAPFERPSHALCIVQPAEGSGEAPAVVIGSDHAHVDMWSLLLLARDLLERIAAIEGDTEPAAPEVAPFSEHTAHLDRMPPAPGEVHARWAAILEAEGGRMPTFPLPLGDVATAHDEIVEVRDVLDAAQTRALEQRAAQHDTRVSAYAMSVLATVTRELAGAPLRAVFPVHSRHEPRWHDSVGWYITNSVIECADPAPRACAAAIKEALTLGSYPLAPLLEPWGGMPATPGMFAISWLDTRRLPAAPSARGIQYVSAVIRTDGVMIWFIIGEDGLHLRCRYPDTAEARRNVRAWLDAVEHGLREATTAATPY